MLGGGESIPVAPAVLGDAVELRYVANEDIAFNALARLGVPRSPGVLLALSAVALVGIGALALTARRRQEGEGEGMDQTTQVALALVVAGALGNIVDRVLRGYVIDFIHVRGWPVFNVADVAVVLGMGLFALAQLRARKRAPS